MLPFLKVAAKIAIAAKDIHIKNFLFGGVCIRKDGAAVTATNGPVTSSPMSDYRMLPNSHCEGRLLLKADRGATIYVARILKVNGSCGMARPCIICYQRCVAHKIARVYYTIDSFHYGVLKFSSSGNVEERVVSCD